MTAAVRFLPWVRPAAVGDGLRVRAGSRDIPVPIRHFGPGDVIGIDRREILRRVPAPNSVGYAPNLFPFVELRSPDLPWRLSSGGAPWLALVVQPAPSGSPLARRVGPLPVLAIAADQLPSTAELGLWCHAQVTGETAAPLAGGIARVVAPRRLVARTRYIACLVPCFEAGRAAGLGEAPADPRAEEPAWTAGRDATLPVYDHWFFTTGEPGDFEALARRLRPNVLTANEPPWTIDVAVPGSGAVTGFFTSLVPRGHVDAWAGQARAVSAASLRAWLDTMAAAGSEPLIGPPLYGGPAAGATGPESGWLEDVNVDPRRRAAAALGAEAVRRSQDDLVAEAWRQLGDIRRANRERDLTQLGAAVTACWAVKHLAVLAPEAAAVVTAPVLARARRADRSLAGEVAASALPAAMLSPAFRRLATVHGRATPSMLAADLLRQSVRAPTLGATPAPPPQLLTASRLRALQASTTGMPAAPSQTSPTSVLGWQRPAAAVASVLFAQAAAPAVAPVARGPRAAAIDAGLEALRARRPRRVEVARPPALALAEVAAVATAALGTSQAPARLDARMTLGDVVIDRVSTSPMVGDVDLEAPVAELLRAIDPRYLVAGITIPPDSVGLLTPNAAFIEAVMLGANQELGGELCWRGAAIDPRRTLLRRFFDVRGRTSRPPPDLPPVDSWSRTSRLGEHLAVRDHTVIVFRGELVRRFADALIFAAHATRQDGLRKPSWAAGDGLEPVFRGMLTDDTVFVGFDRSPEELRGADGLGWYVVIAERPGGASFGLDEPGPRSGFATWADLAWDDVTVDGGYLRVADRAPAPLDPHGGSWGRDGAHMAAITAQRPMRIAFHTHDLLPPEGT